PEHLAVVRSVGPLMLLAYAVINLLFSMGERALYYSPAEVNFLFSGPYSPRQLLIYRIASAHPGLLASAVFMMLFFTQHARIPFAAFVGVFLGLELMFLVSLAVVLAFN